MPRTALAALLALLALTICSPPAQAAGFEGPGVAPAVTRAVDVLNAQDDAPCVLEGRLVEKLPRRKHRYLFEDRSGQVVVKIENAVFGQSTVTPKDKIRLQGHVDWNRKRPNTVEVDSLTILGPVTDADLPPVQPRQENAPGHARHPAAR